MKSTALLAALALLPAQMFAQELPTVEQVPAQLSYEQAIQLALRNNVNRQTQLNRVGVLERQTTSAFANMLPVPSLTLGTDLGGGRSTRSGNTTTSRNSGTSARLSFGMTIWDGGDRLNTYKDSKDQQVVQQLNIQSTELNTIRNITRLYYQVQASERTLQVEERNVLKRKEQLEDTNMRLEMGRQDVLDVMIAQQALDDAQSSLEDVRENVQRAKLNLLRELGVTGSTDFALTTPLQEPGPIPSLGEDTLIQMALQGNLQQRTRRVQLDVQRRGYGVDKRNRYMPTVSASAGFSRSVNAQGYSAFFDPSSDLTGMNGSLSVSLSLRNLVQFPQSRAQFASQAASIYDAELNMRESERLLEQNVKIAILELRSAYRALDRARATLALRREQVLAADEKLNAGTIDFFNYQSVIDQAEQAERAILSQQLNVLLARIELDVLLGRRPEL